MIYRVYRGGSWSCCPEDLRSAFRVWDLPDLRYDVQGFRVVEVPESTSRALRGGSWGVRPKYQTVHFRHRERADCGDFITFGFRIVEKM